MHRRHRWHGRRRARVRRRVLLLALVACTAAALLSVAQFRADPARAASTPTNVLHAPASLRPGQQLVSLNGNFRLSMAADGRLRLLTRWGRVVWSPDTGRQRAAQLRLTRTGTLELVSGTGARLWTIRRSAVHARLVLRNNAVLRLAAGRTTLWHTRTAIGYGAHDNPVPQSRLEPGGTLAAGGSLTSANGGYLATMGANGVLAIRTSAGRKVWSTYSTGWPGTRLTLTRGGDLVLRGADGSRLWSARTPGGALLVLGNRGNLVLDDAQGRPIWQSAKAAEPQIFPPATSTPPVSTSHFVRDLAGGRTDAHTMSTAGCADARANRAGHRYLAVLHIGSQHTDVDGHHWGVILSTTSSRLTDPQLVRALKGYVHGYATCMPSYSRLLLGVATNNDSRQYFTSSRGCPRPPSGRADPLAAAGGANWADHVIDPLAAYAKQWPEITVAGANDVEGGFVGCPGQTMRWAKAYLAHSAQPYAFVGSADGCPGKLGGRGDCLHGWTQRALYRIAFGMKPARSVPMPQVFLGVQARQWANISSVGPQPIRFGGVLTAHATCARPRSGCTSYVGATAWRVLWRYLNRSKATSIAGLPYASDMRVN